MAEKDLLRMPQKSKTIYLNSYNTFKNWRLEKGMNSSSEEVLCTYFQELSTKYKPTSLYTIFSMLKTAINVYENINIEKCSSLLSFLKTKQIGFKPKTAKPFTPEQIDKFLNEADDLKYLPTKVGLIMGVLGACRCEEMYNLKIKDIEDVGSKYLVSVPDMKYRKLRRFIIKDQYYTICKKYISGRTPETNSIVFLQFRAGKIIKQRIGINSFLYMPKAIAKFLKLENIDTYSGHSFRKSFLQNRKFCKKLMTQEPITTRNDGNDTKTVAQIPNLIVSEPAPKLVTTNAISMPPPLQLLIMNENGEMVDVGKSGVTETFANNLAKTWAKNLMKLEPAEQLKIIMLFNNSLNQEVNMIPQTETTDHDPSPVCVDSVDISYDLDDLDVKVNEIDIEPTQIIVTKPQENDKMFRKRLNVNDTRDNMHNSGETENLPTRNFTKVFITVPRYLADGVSSNKNGVVTLKRLGK